MTPKCIEHLSTRSEGILHDNEQRTSCVVDIGQLSKIPFGTYSIEMMCTTKKDSHVYKRRKLRSKTNDFLLNKSVSENATISTAGQSCRTTIPKSLFSQSNTDMPHPLGASEHCGNENKSVSLNSQHSQSTAIRPSLNYILLSDTNARNCGLECEGTGEVSEGDIDKERARIRSGVADQCSSSVSSMEIKGNDAGDFVTCNAVDPLIGFASSRALCIYLLKSSGILKSATVNNVQEHAEDAQGNNSNMMLSCKICAHLENPSKMLICDLCEEAFHLSCSNNRAKDLSQAEWFCKQCSRKNPKSVFGRLRAGDVRIGRCYQAEVPEWSGPTSSGDGHFDESAELDPSEFFCMDEWKDSSKTKPRSIGNWIQCNGVIDIGDGDNSVICGKWRRAPLFVSQTENWDCSCAVLWDPIHADCAVPQELETAEILMHLKYVSKLKPQIEARLKQFNYI